MSYADLKKWFIFNLLEDSICENIRMAFVYGNSGKEALIVTRDEVVYALTIVSEPSDSKEDIGILKRMEIESLRNKKLKTFAWGSAGHILALTQSGQLYGWGNNNDNQISNTNGKMCLEPLNLSNAVDNKFIVDIACGPNHSLVLASDGSVYVWGRNVRQTKFEYPVADNNLISIDCGQYHNMIVLETGVCHYWLIWQESGYTLKVPTALKKVVCARNHMLALDNNGQVYTGQLPSGDESVSCFLHNSSQTTVKMGFIIDIAAHHTSEISAVINRERKVFILDRLSYQGFSYCTSFTNLHDVFAMCTQVKIMHRPLILDTPQEPINTPKWLETAFDDSETSDLVFKVDEKSIYVHKCFLQMRSIYFRTMFKEEWKNSGLNVIENNVFKYDVYKSFLKYLYTGEVDIEAEHLVELWKAGHLYMEPSLCKRCLSIVKQTMTVENVVTLYMQAVDYNCKDLRIICSQFTFDRMTPVFLSPAFQELNETIAKDFVINVAKCETFKN